MFEQRPKQMERSRQLQWRHRLGARTSHAASPGVHFAEREGLPGVLKSSDSDSRMAWSLMKLPVRCRPPGNLVEIHWYAFREFAALTLYGHVPLGPVCAQHACDCVRVCGCVCVCGGGRVLSRR